jgi:hypothetical protein
MKRFPVNKSLLFIGGIVLVLFLHFVPVVASDTNNIYNKPGEEIIMAPRDSVIKLNEKHIKLTHREISADDDVSIK